MKWLATFIVISAYLLGSPFAAAQHKPGLPVDPNHFTVYGGAGTLNTFSEVMSVREIMFSDDYYLGASFGRDLYHISPDLRIEWELGAMFHSQNSEFHTEGTAGFNLRWHTPPGDRWLDTSLAIGSGISVASKVPPLEKQRVSGGDETAATLHLITAEFTAKLHETPNASWHGVLRVHHRSGAFGLYNGVDSGSNFYSVGLRRRF